MRLNSWFDHASDARRGLARSRTTSRPFLVAFALATAVAAVAQDRTRPVLTSTSPPNGAQGVDPSSPVRFVFDEPMKPQQRITWISSPTAIGSNAVAYSWSPDGLELTATPQGRWPTNQSIAWLFQPALPAIPGFSPAIPSFEDLAGNRPAGGAGTFTTSSGGPPPWIRSTNSCGLVSSNLLRTSLHITFSAHHTQTNDATPSPSVVVGSSPSPSKPPSSRNRVGVLGRFADPIQPHPEPDPPHRPLLTTRPLRLLARPSRRLPPRRVFLRRHRRGPATSPRA